MFIGETTSVPSLCQHCQRADSHALGCAEGIAVAARLLIASNRSNAHAIAAKQARLYADALDDETCAEALHWFQVAGFIKMWENEHD